LVTQSPHLAQPSKAALRAAIPPYDESMVKRIAQREGKKGEA